MSEPASARLSHWYRNDGDIVHRGEPLFAIETDKASVDVPATESGRLRQLAEVGDVIRMGVEIARIDPA